MSKKEKSLPEKVKHFFSKRESSGINFDKLKKEPYVISAETLKDISSENSQSQRLKALKDLYEIVLTKTLEKYAIEALCKHVEDLLDAQNPALTRHVVFQFYNALIHGQLEHMTIMRTYFFKVLVDHNIAEDLSPRLEMLKELSKNGKTISYFEEEIGPFLLSWFPEILSAGKTADFLPLITNVIKFNAAYLYDNIVAGFIEYICIICSKPKSAEEVQESLNILDAILCYSHVPKEALQRFIFALCLTVNMKNFVQCSWKHMRNLLGTNAWHNSIFTLCLMLQDQNYYKQPQLIRGAIFFLGVALWGPEIVPTLTHPPTAVLPSLLKALDCKENIVAYEVILTLQRLVKDNAQQITSWELIFDIIEKLLDFPELKNPMTVFGKSLHDLITLAEENCLEFDQDRLFEIVEKCADVRSDQSVILLISHITKSINPFHEDFFTKLNRFLDKYFKHEKRSAIQLQVLKTVKELKKKNGYFFEDDLIDKNIHQFMIHIETIPNVSVRKAAAELLTEMAETCLTSLFFDVLDSIEKIMKLMFESNVDGSHATATSSTESCSDVLAAVEGLITAFQKKFFFLPSNHAVKIFNLLIHHLHQQYKQSSYFDNAVRIRKLILHFLLQFRANSQKQVGIFVDDILEYSVHITCDSSYKYESTESAPTSPSPSSFTVIYSGSFLDFGEAFQAIILSLKQEKDWGVLEMILSSLPKLLRNKSLIVRGNCNVSTLCATLCQMVNERSMGFPESLKNAPPRLTRTEVHTRIFPCVAALTSYHSHMESSHIQRLLIKCLQSGLVSRSAKICMEGLTLCTLEMQNSMVKLLPNVLLKLSKFSATVGVAVSVLEFLSNLIRLPNLYVSFVEDQYMSIFAIALPYTNPFKFNQYTVALAHHVIAMWFLKCRIPFRKDFAKFITKGLRSNINIPCDESVGSGTRNEDPSRTGNEREKGQMPSRAITALHTELMETGLDLMARFTFGMCSNDCKRSSISQFLLEKGQFSSWLVGNQIVTITTSGCGTKSFKGGMCETCYSICRNINKSDEADEQDSIFDSEPSPPHGPEPFSVKKKRHRSAVQRSTTSSRELLSSANQSKDDIQLHFPRYHSSELKERSELSPLHHEGSFRSSIGGWPQEVKEKDKSGLCACWCTSWAEIHIRRPTGNTRWMMRIQNQLFLPSCPPEFPLSVLKSLVLPPKREKYSYSSSPSTEEECANLNEPEQKTYEGAIEITPKSTPPVRRTNSSPDMNIGSSYFATFEKEQKKSLELSKNVEKDALQENDLDSLEEITLKKGPESPSKRQLKLDLSKTDEPISDLSESFSKQDISGPSSARILPSTEFEQSSSGSFRDRGHTISVMSPSRPSGSDTSVTRPELNRRSGMSPSFVFLQLFHSSCFGPSSQKPLLLHQTEANMRALDVLDHIPPYDTHKIGVVFVGHKQVDNEVAILSNEYGSTRFVDFLNGLGNIVRLCDVDTKITYLGGLDTKGDDGRFALIWHDDVMQVIFHVATFMRNKETDPMRNEKKKHIANDSVMIVYNESKEDFKLSTIKGQVTNACVIISPEDYNSNVVTVKLKTQELDETFGHSESYIVSDQSLPVFVRQMALHANLAALIISRRQQSSNYIHVSNWLERLRTIKRLRSKVVDELKNKNDSSGFESQTEFADYDDFTDYV